MISTLALTAAFVVAPLLAADVPTNRASLPTTSQLEISSSGAQLARRVDRLSDREQLDLYLGSARRGELVAGNAGRDSQSTRLRKLLRDPALKANFDQIESTWLAADDSALSLFSTPRELIQAKVMIARNLFFQQVAPSAETVAAEAAHILQQRQRVAKIPMFARRDVVFAASADLTGERKRNIFGQTVTQRQITRKGAHLTFLQSANGHEKASLRRQLSRTVASLETNALTFIFEGHGRSESVKFGGSLKASEIAAMIAARPPSGDAPIVITSACDAHTLVRSVLRHLERIAPEATRPIFVVPVEYGQQLIRPIYGDPFLNRELGLASDDTDLGSLIERAEIATSVYVPDENNIPTQVL